ncbi:MMPL family transporter [Williamsia sterculiae]|uniref:Putative drug exporter of the RND superfamily n=1 Tax=Williamsia sterculiae TaxID=1344003 RepID=A0A1N7F710_9NOCA|nr:MMPL family transporter [Williamsia sterculiae]SIR96148.1 putative drug exporter of the RND superfamily [Williamsia sterculiae]
MATFLYRIGKWCFGNRFKVIGIWLLLLVGMGVAGTALSGPTSESFSIPGIPSEKAQNLMKERFPDKPGFEDSVTVKYVIKAPAGTSLEQQRYQDAINAMVDGMKSFDGVKKPESIVNPFVGYGTEAKPGPLRQATVEFQEKKLNLAPAAAQQVADAGSPINTDGTVAQLGTGFDVKAADDVTARAHDQMTAVADQARAAGLTVAMNGTATQSNDFGGASELIGLAVAAVVLILTFGSLVTWGMPILSAIVGVGIGTFGVSVATGFIDLSSQTPILATMIGLAVGIDYALFIVSRYRHELLTADTRAEAAGRALGTAGSAVVFAGLTVLIALAALSIVNIPFLTAMGLAAAGTVLTSVLVALTLLPALLGLFAGKAFAGRLRFLNPPDVQKTDTPRRSNGRRWVGQESRRPALFAVLGVVLLAVIAIPLTGLRLSLPNDGTSDPGTSQRQAYDLIADGYGAGYNGPLVVVADGRGIDAPAQRIDAYNALTKQIAGMKDVRSAQISAGDLTANADTASISVIPRSAPSETATQDLVKDLRGQEGGVQSRLQVSYGVTGQTAIENDVSERLQDSLLPYLLVVVGLAFLLLILVFRSILVPLTAALGFLLSVAATFGATVAIFQRGDLGLIGNPQPIVSFLPIFLIGIVFGLAMDYQVFLVTRMREEYVHGAGARDAVVRGFGHSARVVAGAAAIMMSVFAAFMLQDMSFIKSMGFALAVAVFFDAFVVRMTLIPAVLTLLGDKAWWIPRWLDRILPQVDVEGDQLTKYLAARSGDGDEKRELIGTR